MVEQEKQELIECCKLMIDVSRNHEEVMIAQIALTSLTAQPVKLPAPIGVFMFTSYVKKALDEAGIKFEVKE